MRCTNCGTEASPSEDSCSQCGQPLIVTCPSCSTPGRRDALFCGVCGSYFGAVAAAATPLKSSSGSERKHATVLFVDVVGSTAAVAGLDPEEAMDRLRPMLETMRRVAEEFEGTVVRVTGDGIMALFDAPRALEGHALLACRAAVAIHAAVALLPSRPVVRIGLHSGELVAAQLSGAGLGDGAFGATLHLASRMEQLAPAGATYLSAATHALVRGHFDLHFTGAHQVKGFDAPIDVYELRGLARGQVEEGAPPSAPSFIGRNSEMALLEKALESARAGKA